MFARTTGTQQRLDYDRVDCSEVGHMSNLRLQRQLNHNGMQQGESRATQTWSPSTHAPVWYGSLPVMNAARVGAHHLCEYLHGVTCEFDGVCIVSRGQYLRSTGTH